MPWLGRKVVRGQQIPGWRWETMISKSSRAGSSGYHPANLCARVFCITDLGQPRWCADSLVRYNLQDEDSNLIIR